MKIKNLNLINKHGYSSGSFSEMDRIDAIPWNEIKLQKAKEKELIGVVKEDFQDAGRELIIRFREKEWNVLREWQKEETISAFKENVEKVISEILELNIPKCPKCGLRNTKKEESAEDFLSRKEESEKAKNATFSNKEKFYCLNCAFGWKIKNNQNE